jgi:hypothetical protein
MVQVTKSKNRSVWMIEKKFLPERNRDQAIEDKPLWAGVGFIRKVPVGKDNCLLNLPSELNHLKGKLRIKTKGMQLKAATICEFEIYFNHKNDYAIEIMQSMARDNTLVDSGIAPIEILVEDPLQKIELGSIWEELSVLKNRVLTYDGALISLIYAMSKKLPDQVFLQLSDHLREGISDAFVHLFQVDVDAYQLVTRSELKKDAVWLPSSYSSQIINL